jgi:3-oxoacyl-[acyl-carrier-protein] synthase II
MLNCLRDAGLQPTDVDGLNMHGTSTPLGDMAESKILHVFGEHAYTMNLNSTKSMTGHTWCCRSCRNYFFHSFDEIRNCSINHVTNDENIDSKLNFTFNKAQKREMNVVMSNVWFWRP